MLNRTESSNQLFMETKLGIVTQSGDWFHTTSDQIESFAPGLLAKVPLEKLVKEAIAWVESPGSLSLVLLYILLFLVNPWLAAITVLAFHWVWYNYKSAMVVRGAGPVLSFINSDGFLFIIAFLALSWLGFQQQYAAVGIGILYFFVMKPGFLRKGWDKLSRPGPGELTMNDRVLKMIIIKWAIYEDVAPANVQQMEERLKKMASIRKKGGT